ncbi:diguanylate cyclase (GGDEF) domain-containing protein [Blastococcus aggregatus]|uniref:Diguanylate cyclase (GGDEF) domain-containing protein n=1 Tax=Blastococcus aggregatus TaxID=38502 RepID=A0A285VED1_9ACTN|nr:GGDEF domain-containing protein [Blastococcus aggregatus]SOC50851.1 diguanylate cyclase (GGDEF) domain-containing protein [Blastococcus aggregatus]
MIGPLRSVPPHRGDSTEPPTPSGLDRRVAALSLAALLVIGALMGSINLVVDGVLRDGAPRWAYAVTMLLLFALAGNLAVRGRVGQRHTLALVLLGDLIYLVVVLCIEDPLRYATPLMLLFPALAAAWFLRPRPLLVHMVVITGVCLAALWPSYDSTVGLLAQVGVSAATLNAASAGVFLLRRRVQRLLTATEMLSRQDPLTGLYNRRYLVEQAPRLWAQTRRESGLLSAVVLDLDHFKRLNDEFGHAVGDDVLSAVARSLTATVRPTDLLARTGGEELVVVSTVDLPEEAERLAERLRAAVAGSRGEAGLIVTASVGLAVAAPDDDDPVTGMWRLVERADTAMYAAKRGGRDRVAVADQPPRPAPADRAPEGPPAPRGCRPPDRVLDR